MKRIVSLLSALVLTCTIFSGALPVIAEETQSANQPSIENEISVNGTNSFGNLLSDKLSGKMDEQQQNNGCNIFSAEVVGNEAIVSFETVESGTLLVAVYDESGEQMLASGHETVTTEETEKTVTIETESMPKYFYLRVFLVDTNTLRPICTAYESPNYTQEMQEFFAKTVDDFDSEKVLNLDKDKSNNFAVYGEDTKVIESDGVVNKVTKSDEENGIYVIENADGSVMDLAKDDIFALAQPDGNVLIAKVGTVKVSGKTVTITEQETSMEEVFDYVKIDESEGMENATVDNSNLEEGVIYNGIVGDTPESRTYSQGNTYNSNEAYLPAGPEYQAVEIDVETSKSLSYTFKEKKIGDDNNNVKLSGNVEFKAKGSVKVYISLSYAYLEVKLDLSAKISGSLSGKAQGSIPLGITKFMPVFGVIIKFTPSVVVEVSGKIEFSVTVKTTLGIRVSTDKGIENISSTPKVESELKADVTLFIGLSLEPEVAVINEKVAVSKLKAKIGGEIKASMDIVKEPSSSSRHDCKSCLAGEINAKADLEANAQLANNEKWKFSKKLLDFKIKISDFYYSFDKHKFGWGTCPYKTYKVSISALDENKNPVSDAEITLGGLSANVLGKTDKNGRFETWFSNGDWLITVSKDNKKHSKNITVNEKSKSAKFALGKSNDSIWQDKNLVKPEPSNKPNCTSNNYWVVFYEGFRNKRLEMSTFDSIGETYIVWDTSLKAMNQDGKCNQYYFDDNNEWKKIGTYSILTDYAVDIVASNVDIYNSNHELIYGKSDYNNYDFAEYKNYNPSKNTDSLNMVCLGNNYTGYIDDNGGLYMWGSNGYSQLGNGTREDSLVPTRIIIPSASTKTIPSTSYLAEEPTEPTLKTQHFTELLPNEVYNFYSVLNNELLYVSQGVSDENGNLDISYIPKKDDKGADIFLKGMTKTDISDAEVTVPDILCNGEKQFAQPVVTLDGATLSETDYDIEEQYSAIYPGIYELVIVGTGDYTGKVKATYNIYCKHVFEDYSFETGRCTICKSLINTIGDFNDDYVTGIADVVLLQKYLVGKDVWISKNPDINNDGKVNVFDLIMLKRILIYS